MKCIRIFLFIEINRLLLFNLWLNSFSYGSAHEHVQGFPRTSEISHHKEFLPSFAIGTDVKVPFRMAAD